MHNFTKASQSDAKPVSPLTVLRLPKVIERTGLARSTIYHLLSQNQFPKPVHLGPRAVGWLADEIDAWLEAKVADRVSVLSQNQGAG